MENKINDIATVVGEKSVACNRLRQELETLRGDRKRMTQSGSKEIGLMEEKYGIVKEKLRRKLPQHANIATYRQVLRYYQRDTSKCSSNYIIQQETPLLSAMHRSFCVLANQKEVLEREHEREIYPYFRQEIEALHMDSAKVLDDWMIRLSGQAEENDLLYNSYREELESIEMEVKKYRRLLLHQTDKKNPFKESENGCDESTISSETEHSSGSDDEISSRGDFF